MNEREYVNIRQDLHPDVKHWLDTNQLVQDLQINVNNLTESFASQAPLQFYYGELFGRANAQYLEAKSNLSIVEATVGKSIRAIAGARQVKITESQIEKETPLDPRWQDAQWKLRDARYVLDMLESVTKAFDDRRWMLQSQGKSEQTAMQGQLRLIANG
jgi:hypothetical protein